VRRLRFLLALAVSAGMLTGCWDRREINDVAFVLGTSLDKEGDRLVASLQFPLPSTMGGAGSRGGGGGTGGDKPWYSNSVIGKSLGEIRYKQQRSVSRHLFLGHRRVFLFGEELARSGIERVLDEVVRNPISRLDTYVLVTEGPAAEMLNADVTVEKLPVEKIRELNNTFMNHPANFKYVIDVLNSEGIDLALPYIRKHVRTGGVERDQIVPLLDSVAVFREGRMVGILQGYHASSLLWMMDEARRPLVIIPGPTGKGSITVQMQRTSSSIRPVIRGRDISFRITLDGYGYVMENTTNQDLSSHGRLEIAERLLRGTLEEQAKETLDLLQREWHADPLGLGREIHRHAPRLWKEIRDGWKDIYRELDIAVEARAHLENTGLLVSPAGVDEDESEEIK